MEQTFIMSPAAHLNCKTMSVLIPDLKVYEYVSCGLQRTMWESQCTAFRSYSVYKHFNEGKGMDTMEEERHRLVVSWCTLNEMSYCAAYAHHGEKFQCLSAYIRKHVLTHKELTPWQLLMYLRCVRYNIELETIVEKMGESAVSEQDRKDYELLTVWIDELAYAIIDNMPEYKACSYAS